MTNITIRPASDDRDVACAADLIARSFDHLAANRYLVPNRQLRLPIMREYFHLLTAHAADGGGEVLLTDGAVAVWFNRTSEPAELADYDMRLAESTGVYLHRFQELDRLLEKNHPTEPHWHLAFLAVQPELWGHGRGSALMKHTHTRLDRQGIGAYLEATNANNRRLYKRHGYLDIEPSVIHLSDGTPFYRMCRPAT